MENKVFCKTSVSVVTLGGLVMNSRQYYIYHPTPTGAAEAGFRHQSLTFSRILIDKMSWTW